MAVLPFKTLDGVLTLDSDTKTVSMSGQGGSVVNGSATVDHSGAIDKRITATRLVLTGPLALAWRKKKDDRELYLLVEGSNYALVARVEPSSGAAARQFAAAINTVARGGSLTPAAFSGPGLEKAKLAAKQERRAKLTPEQRRRENLWRAVGISVLILVLILFVALGH